MGLHIHKWESESINTEKCEKCGETQYKDGMSPFDNNPYDSSKFLDGP